MTVLANVMGSSGGAGVFFWLIFFIALQLWGAFPSALSTVENNPAPWSPLEVQVHVGQGRKDVCVDVQLGVPA